MRALGFEPKKEEIKKMISDIDKVYEFLLPVIYVVVVVNNGVSRTVGWLRDNRLFRVLGDDDC
jgi:hypothetical protein